jgi:DNA-binding transcriptional ArsR family regulator
MRELARFFKALGDETRLGLVALLAQQEPHRALCVGRLARELGVTDSAVSQHLRVLKDLGLVHAERRGYRLHYFLDSERLAAYQDLVREQLGEEFVVRERRTNAQGRGNITREGRITAPQAAR